MNIRKIIKDLQEQRTSISFEAYDDGVNDGIDSAIDRLRELEKDIKLILTGEKEHSRAEQVLLDILGEEKGK